MATLLLTLRAMLAAAVLTLGTGAGAAVFLGEGFSGFCSDNDTPAQCDARQPSTAALVVAGVIGSAMALGSLVGATLLGLGTKATARLGRVRSALTGALLWPLLPAALTVAIVATRAIQPRSDLYMTIATVIFVGTAVAYSATWASVARAWAGRRPG